MSMSPIYEDRRVIKASRELESGYNLSIILTFILISFPIIIASTINDYEDFSGWVFLAWLIAPFVGFGNLVGKLFRSNFINNYNHEYENILNKYKSISQKKVNSKYVDNIDKYLETNKFSYLDILEIVV